MPPKRKRTSVSETRSDTSESSQPPPAVKRKRRGAKGLRDQCQEIYDTIRNHKADDGRLLCEPFIRSSKRSGCDLLKVQQKIKGEEYSDMDQFTADIKLIVDNAASQYPEGASEHHDATALWELFSCAKGEAVPGSESSRASSPAPKLQLPQKEEVEDEGSNADSKDSAPRDVQAAVPQTPDANGGGTNGGNVSDASLQSGASDAVPLSEQLEELFGAVYLAKDENRELSSMFQLLPAREKYPEYYDVITEPMDLKTIGQNIRDQHYTTLEALERDLLLMVKNAKAFNEPGSQIYKDASTLKKLVASRRAELELQKAGTPIKSSERIRAKRSTGGRRYSLVCAALTYPSEDEAEQEEGAAGGSVAGLEDESLDGTEQTSPLWLLYHTVKNHKNNLGQFLSDPFLKLPRKRTYPDYYEEIEKPLSLLGIKQNIKRGQYKTLGELVQDLELMFRNAMQYNEDESRLFKDAMRLQKVMRDRAKELEKMEVKHEPEPILLPVVPCVAHKDPDPPKGGREATVIVLKREMGLEQPMDEDSRGAPSTPVSSIGSPGAGTWAVRNTPGTPVTESASPSYPATPSPAVTPVVTFLESGRKKPGRRPMAPEELKNRRLWKLFNAINDAKGDNGRLLREIFRELPSKKAYPDYYQVITEPIDLTIIEGKIRADKYYNEYGIVQDLELLFKNAKHYNEENSQVYLDAESLEKLVKHRWRTIGIPTPTDNNEKPLPGGMPSRKAKPRSAPLSVRLQLLYGAVKDCRNTRGRLLSAPYMVLPSKTDYPNYYEVIRKPMDLTIIGQKITSNKYHTLEDCAEELLLVCDNACRYNEPFSGLYKDALSLRLACLRKKNELTENDTPTTVPDVRAAVQELMTAVFVAVYNHQDDEGRYFADSFAELQEVKEPAEDPSAPLLTFDQIKWNMDQGRYRRLDRFQMDMFSLFERARRFSGLDSQLYEDAVELQTKFIRARDEACRSGERVVSPCLVFTFDNLQMQLEAERANKQTTEKEDEKPEPEKIKEAGPGSRASVDFAEQTFRVGDFVYLEPREQGGERHITCIEKLYQEEDGGEQFLYGCWFLRPQETFHHTTRKFLEKEVFRSDYSDKVPISEVRGKCHVMWVKDYFKQKPMDIPEADVYVCESRYSAKLKNFKKIKMWQVPMAPHVEIVERETPLTPSRVASVYKAERSSAHTNTEDQRILDVDRQNILQEQVQDPQEGCTYYQQYFFPPLGWFKIGDYVYVRSDNNQQYICRIGKMWTDRSGYAFIHGPWFVFPAQIEHNPTRIFHHNEVFLTGVENACALCYVLGKCNVLWIKNYCHFRPIEYAEEHVFVCESKYVDTDKSIRKLSKFFKKGVLSQKVMDDELYYFKHPIAPLKEPSPFLPKDQVAAVMGSAPDDMDDPSDGFQTPAPRERKRQKPYDMQTPRTDKFYKPRAYILFSSEIRKTIQDEFKDLSFGEISRIVGEKWKSLPVDEKAKYEARAKKIHEEQQAKRAQLQEEEEREKARQEQVKQQQQMQKQQQMQWQQQQQGYGGANYVAPHQQQQPGYRPVAPYPGPQYPPQQQGQYPPQPQYGQYPPQQAQGQYPPPPQGQYPGATGPQQQFQQPAPPQARAQLPGAPGPQGQPQYPQAPPPQQSMPPPQATGQAPQTLGPVGQAPGYPQTGSPFARPPSQPGPQAPHPIAQAPNGAPPGGAYHPVHLPPLPHLQNGGGPYYPPPMAHPGGAPPPPMRLAPPVASPPPAMLPLGGQMTPLNGNGGPPPPSPQHVHVEPLPLLPHAPAVTSPPPKPASPMFVSVPPRTQRLLHSEAYLKYIEGLRPDKKYMSDWDKHLTASQENTRLPANGKLPVEWLGKGVGSHGDAVSALWALRDYMLKDALTVSRTLTLEEL